MLGTEDSAKASNTTANNETEAGDFNRNVPNLRVYSLADIEAATEGFSIRNKLGEGGYGPVYKVTYVCVCVCTYILICYNPQCCNLDPIGSLNLYTRHRIRGPKHII